MEVIKVDIRRTMIHAFVLLHSLISALFSDALSSITTSMQCRDSCAEFGPRTFSLFEPNKPCRCLKYGGYRILMSHTCTHFQDCLESCDALSFDHAFCISRRCLCANTYALFVANSRIKRKTCVLGKSDCRIWCMRRGFRKGWCSEEHLCACLPYKPSQSPETEKSYDGCVIPLKVCGRVCVALGFEGGICFRKTCSCLENRKSAFGVTYVGKSTCELSAYQCILKCAFIFHQKASCVGSKCICRNPSNHSRAYDVVNDDSFRNHCYVPNNYCFRMCLDLGYADGFCTKTVCDCWRGHNSKTINLLDESSCVRAKDICREACIKEQFVNDACYDTDCICYTGSSYLIKRMQPSNCFIPETFCQYLCKKKQGHKAQFTCEGQACECNEGSREVLRITTSSKCDASPADCHTQCQLDGFHRSFCYDDDCGCLDNANRYFDLKTVEAGADYRQCEVPIRYCRHFCQRQGFAVGTCEGSRCLCVPEYGVFELDHRASCELPENRCELGCSESSFPKAYCIHKHCLCTANSEGPFEIKF